MVDGDDLTERRERRDASPAVAPVTRQLFSMATDHMAVTVAEDEKHVGRVLLSVTDTRSGRQFAVTLTTLELDVLAYGLSQVARRVGLEEGRR